MNLLRHVLLIISPLLYALTGLILLSGLPQLLKGGDFGVSTISIVLTLFLVAIHAFVIWNVVKRKHITLILAPCFEAYFLFNLYLFMRPFSAEKILVFDTVTYPELMLAAGVTVCLVCAIRFIPLIVYRDSFIN